MLFILLCLLATSHAFVPPTPLCKCTVRPAPHLAIPALPGHGRQAQNRMVMALKEQGDICGGGSGEGRGWWESAMVRMGYKDADVEQQSSPKRSIKDKLKSAGIAGVLSYVSSEVLFWFISLPLGILAFKYTTGEWLDLSTSEGQAKVAGFSAGFLAFARVALPVRAAVALAMTPALDKYVIRPLVEKGVLKDQSQ